MLLNARRQSLVFPALADGIERGYPLHAAWEHAVATYLRAPGPRLAEGLARTSEALRSGETLAVALRGLADEGTLSMISTGEEVGDLPATLRALVGEAGEAAADRAALGKDSRIVQLLGPDAVLWAVGAAFVALVLVGLLYRGPDVPFAQRGLDNPATRRELREQRIPMPGPAGVGTPPAPR